MPKKFRNITRDSWYEMKRRCLNPNHHAYASYGGRGIQVCNRWMDYQNFLSDMGERPNQGYSIERIDNNGNYEPSNCKWANKYEQANNRRTNKLLTYQGETLTLTQWSQKLEINRDRLESRVRRGWSPEKAFQK